MGLLDWLFGGRRSTKPQHDVPASSVTPLPAPILPVSAPPSRYAPMIVWRDDSYPMNAVGESQYQDALQRICGPHSRYGHHFDAIATLVREPHNPHDQNAVAVEIQNMKVGYLSREDARRVGGQMDEEGLVRVDCKALIAGGWRTNQHDEGSFGVRLAIPNWGWIDMGTGKTPPPAPVVERKRPALKDRPKPAKKGPLVGQRVVLWGLSDTGPEAIELAHLGARILTDVGKSTTLIVNATDTVAAESIGTAAYRMLHERKAAGSPIEIVSLRALRERLEQKGS